MKHFSLMEVTLTFLWSHYSMPLSEVVQLWRDHLLQLERVQPQLYAQTTLKSQGTTRPPADLHTWQRAHRYLACFCLSASPRACQACSHMTLLPYSPSSC